MIIPLLQQIIIFLFLSVSGISMGSQGNLQKFIVHLPKDHHWLITTDNPLIYYATSKDDLATALSNDLKSIDSTCNLIKKEKFLVWNNDEDCQININQLFDNCNPQTESKKDEFCKLFTDLVAFQSLAYAYLDASKSSSLEEVLPKGLYHINKSPKKLTEWLNSRILNFKNITNSTLLRNMINFELTHYAKDRVVRSFSAEAQSIITDEKNPKEFNTAFHIVSKIKEIWLDIIKKNLTNWQPITEQMLHDPRLYFLMSTDSQFEQKVTSLIRQCPHRHNLMLIIEEDIHGQPTYKEEIIDTWRNALCKKSSLTPHLQHGFSQAKLWAVSAVAAVGGVTAWFSLKKSKKKKESQAHKKEKKPINLESAHA